MRGKSEETLSRASRPLKGAQSSTVLEWISLSLALLSGGVFLFIVLLIATGFPPNLFGWEPRLKHLKTPLLLFAGLITASIAVHPDRKHRFARTGETIRRATSSNYALWVLFAVYSLLFLWQQLTEYWSVNINFLPFSFFDYMLFYNHQGKLNYTALLHTFYHMNHILLLFEPLWAVFKSPMVLVLSYGFIAAAAIIPLWAIARLRFPEHRYLPFFVCLIYLNYRYLQNILLMNFSPEIFYSLFVFAAVYAAMRYRWGWYYLFLGLGLSVKEDSFMYFAAIGLLTACLGGFRKPRSKAFHLHGLVTILLSFAHIFFLMKIVAPLTGSTIFEGDLRNYAGHGGSIGEIATNLLRQPLQLLAVFVNSSDKWETYGNILYRLAFLPLFSPAGILILAPLFPLFFHHAGNSTDFVNLHFHYAGAVIPFVFVAFVFGYSNLIRRIPPPAKSWFILGSLVLLLAVNLGRYTSRRIDPQDLKSIQWAKSLPVDSNVVTPGHLLPYIGYREYNYYFAAPWERGDHPFHKQYTNADYYLIDFHVNPWPMNESFFADKLKSLLANRDYQLLRSEEGKRYLFKRISHAK